MEQNTGNFKVRQFDVTTMLFVLFMVFSVYLVFNFVQLWLYKAKPFELDEVAYKITVRDIVFDVTIDDIRKEKGKEDVYTVVFKDLTEHSIRFSKKMTKTEFDEVIGLGNNTLTTRVHTLDYILQSREKRDGGIAIVYNLKFMRFACFGQVAFTKDEIVAYAPEIVAHANARQKGIESPYDATKLALRSNSERVELTLIDWDKSLNEDLKALPNINSENKEITPQPIDIPIVSFTKYVPVFKHTIGRLLKSILM